MKANILGSLCCPACKGALQLTAFEQEWVGRQGEEGSFPVIREGVLICGKCSVRYPIHSGIPVLLLFETSFHRMFEKLHEDKLRSLAGVRPPQGRPRTGERRVQETFTDEWNQLRGDELSFYYTKEDLVRLHRNVWLKWMGKAETDIRKVLNVGCGAGKEAEALSEVIGNAEIFAIDLNFSLLNAGEMYKTRREMNFLIASLFDLPFPAGQFDLVYSQGVIHHTYSTRDAFQAIASHVKKGGYLFIWIYGLDDYFVEKGLKGLRDRVTYAGEIFLRSILTRSPGIVRDAVFYCLSILMHGRIKKGMKNSEKWKLRNTNHTLRDNFSPPYVHRHSYNEVIEWYEESGFDVIDVQSPGAFRRLFGRRLWGVGATGRKS